MACKLFSGVATAIITPFLEDKIDFEAFERLIERQISLGADALVVCGTTGEAPTLTENEKKSIYDFAIKTVNGRIPVICGTATNSHSVTMRLSTYAIKAGADGLLCVSPYYNKGTDEGIVICYREICSLGIPVILYNIPSRSGVDINGELLSKLSEEENLAGIKECAGIGRIFEHKRRFGDRFSIYSGNDSEMLGSFAVGADGIISVVSNLYPDRVKRIFEDYESGENIKALRQYSELGGICELMFGQTNPSPIKYALSRLGLCKNTLRLPMTPIKDGLCQKIDNELKKLE